MKQHQGHWLNLPSLGLSIRVLFSGYLLAISLGLLLAGVQILLTHGMADGEFGLSIDDIVYSYYGDRNNSRLENALNGAMKNKAPEPVRLEIINWARDGAPKADWDRQFKNVFAQHCTSCHGALSGIPDFNDYAQIEKVASTDNGEGIDTLTRVSHIHLFGIAFIFFFVGFIFSMAVGLPRWLKEVVIAMPFAFLIIDVLSWWLTSLHPGFAWLTMVSGIGYGLAAFFMLATSMYQMWFMPPTGETYINEWRYN